MTESLIVTQGGRNVLLISDSVPRSHSLSSVRFGDFAFELAQQGHNVTLLPLTLHRGASSSLTDRLDSSGVSIVTKESAGTLFSFLEKDGHSFDLIVMSAKAARDARSAVDRFAPICERVVDLVGADVELPTNALEGLSAALVVEHSRNAESKGLERLAPINISEAVDIETASSLENNDGADARSPAILHLHLFKNAGSSVDAALVSAYGERWLSFDAPFHAEPRGPADLAHLLRTRPELQLSLIHI